LLNITVGRLLEDTAARFPERAAVETPNGVLTYCQLNNIADDTAGRMLCLGIEKGTHLGIWSKDRPYSLIAYLAAEKIGAVPVLFNTSLTGPELSVLIDKTDVEFLFFDDGYRGISFPEICSHLIKPARGHLIYIGEGEADGFLSLGDLPSCEAEIIASAKRAVLPSDTDVIIFTSGTSGAAKGVETSHAARVNSASAHVKALELTEKDKLCVALPMFHCFGLTGVTLSAISAGACLYFPPERRTRYLLEAISAYKCTVLSAVPTLFSAILARSDFSSYDLSSLRTGFIGGALYTPEFFRRVENSFGSDFRLIPSLGQTEATAGFTFISSKEPQSVRESTIGAFMEGIEGKICDIKTGTALPPGQEGEICVRGFTVMKGYYKEPALTAAAVDSCGWLHTGDLARMDESGNLHMTGRLKELIIRGGENIAPGEIEAVILSYPGVRDVKVISVPDKHYGEEICACVILAPCSELNEDEVRSHAALSLSEFKIPRYVVFLSEFPKTSSGKTAVAELRGIVLKKLALS
jgi:fatty-acyl-CoA synthase